MSVKRKILNRARPKITNAIYRTEEIREKLGLSDTEFSLALGFSTGGGYPTARRNGISVTLLLAAEGLLAQRSPSVGVHTVNLLLTVTNGVCTNSQIVQPEEAVIGGKKYFMIEHKE